jgi:hypothetical protein
MLILILWFGRVPWSFEYDAKEKYKDDDGSFPKLNQKS